jgi:hypothetical protein
MRAEGPLFAHSSPRLGPTRDMLDRNGIESQTSG